MVQFPRYRFCPLCIHEQMNAIQDVRVTPFGHPRISGCLLLPVAFRSLPRPSSPDSSKASPANSSSLDHITPTSSFSSLDQTRYLNVLRMERAKRASFARTSSTFSVPFSVVPVTPVTSPKLSKTRPRPRARKGAAGERLGNHAATVPPRRYPVSWRYGDSNPRPMACKAIALAI